jgi:hypothetical protein
MAALFPNNDPVIKGRGEIIFDNTLAENRRIKDAQ